MIKQMQIPYINTISLKTIILHARSGQRFVHETLLAEAQPKFVWFSILRWKHLLTNTSPSFLTKLLQVESHLIWNKKLVVRNSSFLSYNINSPASFGVGLAYTEFKGNPDSPGMSNLDNANVYISWRPCALLGHRCNFLRHSGIYKVI